MSNLIRSSNRLPFDFQDGLKVAGKDISLLIEELITTSNSRVVLSNSAIIAGLGFTPVNRSGDTMSGNLTVNGNILASGDVTAYSDERLKSNWANVGEGFVDKLSKVKSGTYTRIDMGTRQVGVSAQSLKEILPEAVLKDKETLSVAYGNASLVSSIELAKEVVALKEALTSSNRNIEMLTGVIERMDTELRQLIKEKR